MGKRIIQQRRGRGTGAYRAPSFNYQGKVVHNNLDTSGTVVDIIHCAGHSAPLIEVQYLTGNKSLAFAPEKIKVGDSIIVGGEEIKSGNVLRLKNVPEGTLVHNLELRPGDGGKLVRASGSFAKVVAKTEKAIRVKLPSNKEKLFLPECRASIGIIAGGGRLEKPLMKAGNRFHKMKARNKLYPKVCGISMNAVDHPFGGCHSTHKGRPTLSPRSAPPGRKVGKIAPRRTGRRK
ncbi:50S ribosomal protein L2 [Candidatus Woesearchaeota archaeon]|jgi:large subunit ribosomal protein L2|nr:50S ribosomal protein L2 [Candidatus Woesearchaeota archaeon]MBT4110367.1 50S ribosomal protein L2 [Candidatus Woesearchaeota archaeon]MBT4336109.1 50S ribosomal protein L2 [Candidatus Woesearchaeota archaeon]MBT4468912.1 50S ribosomal protein L2 [Candidatus Woesearchaeota archaeon]MBT6744769.1 50S ribosomal protein L2 [Candidatus Woesearchaeota archaeon]